MVWKKEGMVETDSDWNMAVEWLKRLARRFEDANISSQEGNLVGWYRSLRNIVSMIHFKIREDGNESVEEEMYRQLDLVKKLIMNTEVLKLAERGQVLTSVEENLEKLDTQLHDLCHDYNLIGMKQFVDDPNYAIDDNF